MSRMENANPPQYLQAIVETIGQLFYFYSQT
jgi:hypothetical protein